MHSTIIHHLQTDAQPAPNSVVPPGQFPPVCILLICDTEYPSGQLGTCPGFLPHLLTDRA